MNAKMFAHLRTNGSRSVSFPHAIVARWSKMLDSSDLNAKDVYLKTSQIGDVWESATRFRHGASRGEPVMRLVRVA